MKMCYIFKVAEVTGLMMVSRRHCCSRRREQQGCVVEFLCCLDSFDVENHKPHDPPHPRVLPDK